MLINLDQFWVGVVTTIIVEIIVTFALSIAFGIKETKTENKDNK